MRISHPTLFNCGCARICLEILNDKRNENQIQILESVDRRMKKKKKSRTNFIFRFLLN